MSSTFLFYIHVAFVLFAIHLSLTLPNDISYQTQNETNFTKIVGKLRVILSTENGIYFIYCDSKLLRTLSASLNAD